MTRHLVLIDLISISQTNNQDQYNIGKERYNQVFGKLEQYIPIKSDAGVTDIARPCLGVSM